MSNYDPATMVPLLGSFGVELTNHCNLKCGICWSQNPQIHPPREKGFMSPWLFKKIVDQLAEYYETKSHRRMFLSLSYGGESLLHPDFDELLAYAASKRAFKIQLITNGILLREHLPELNRHKVLVTVSYHAHPPELKKQVDQNITSLLVRRGLNRTNIAVVDAEAPGLFKEAKAKFGPMVYNYPLITEDLKYVDGERAGESFCRFPFTNMVALWNGDVWPCCRLLSSDFPSLGNLNESTVAEVWDGEAYKRLRQDPDSYPCRNCELY